MNENIKLKPIEFEDLDKLHKWRNDETIFTQLGGGYFPVSKTEMSKWMDNFSKKDTVNIRFMIEYNSFNVGFVSLTNINYINRNASLGIYIGEKEYHGKGIATEALKLLHQFAINHLNLLKIKLGVSIGNEGAIRLYEKNGYQPIGIQRREWYNNGEWLDVKLMEHFLKRSDYN